MTSDKRRAVRGAPRTWFAGLGAAALVVTSLFSSTAVAATPGPLNTVEQAPDTNTFEPAAVGGLLAADADAPPVEDVAEASVEFAEAVVDDEYTSKVAVTDQEAQHDQTEAVKAAQEEETDRSKVSGIARVDLEADVAVFGVTWDADELQPDSVYWRSLSDGVWSEWEELDKANASVGDNLSIGTEPVSVANSESIEVVARTADGNSVPGLNLHLINAASFATGDNVLLDIYPDEVAEDSDDYSDEAEEPTSGTELEEPLTEVEVEAPEQVEETQDAEETAPVEAEDPQTERDTDEEPVEDVLLDREGAVEGENVSHVPATGLTGLLPTKLNSDGTVFDTGYEGLKIGTRKFWCNGSASCLTSSWTPEPITVQGAVVHHTESTNNYTRAQVPQQIRNIHHYHANTLRWGDIGYNLIVDKYGGVWEGRYGGLTKGVKGAQAYGANSETIGITVLGGYMTAAPPTVARSSLTKAIAWKLDLHGVTSATKNIQVPGAANLNAGNNRKISVPAVSAHRDVGWTDCPGDAFYAQMGTVRNEVNAHLAKLAVTPPTPSAPSDGFKPGNVISDEVFYNPNQMNEAQIKSFIENTGSSCSSSGSNKCLKDMTFPTHKMNPIRNKGAEGCEPFTLTGNQRPWSIIDEAAKACGLNPEVILSTIQKEQSGLTQPRNDATWAKAMGAGCPDGSGCYAEQAGFAKQVYFGAEKLATYKVNATWESHILAFEQGQSVTVLNNPATSCGTETFKHENYATASLYMYTPYVGNSSASGCSAIGQKSFWNIMNRYFPDSLAGEVKNPTPPKPVGPPAPTPPAPVSPIAWHPRQQIGHKWTDRIVYAGDWTRNGRSDLMLVTGSGDLMLYEGRGNQSFYQPVKIGHGWNAIDWVQGGVDWNSDGIMDLIARTTTGELRLYPGNGRDRFNPMLRIGTGWHRLDNLAVVQTGSGPGVYATVGTTLRYYPANGGGAFAARSEFAGGGANLSAIIGAGDMTGDRVPDVLTVDGSGVLNLHQVGSNGGLSAGVRVGHAWNQMQAIGSSSQRGTKAPLWAVDANGRLWEYRAK